MKPMKFLLMLIVMTGIVMAEVMYEVPWQQGKQEVMYEGP